MKSQLKSARPAEPPRLDEALARAATKLQLNRWTIPLLVILGVLLVWILYSNISKAARENRITRINQRLYEVFERRSLVEAGGSLFPPSEAPEIPQETLDALLEEARGTEVEHLVLQAVGEHYMTLAEEADRKLEEAVSRQVTGTEKQENAPKQPSEEELQRLEKQRETQLATALKAADEALRSSGKDHPGIQQWATAVRARIEGLRQKDWLKPKPAPEKEPAPEPAVPPSG